MFSLQVKQMKIKWLLIAVSVLPLACNLGPLILGAAPPATPTATPIPTLAPTSTETPTVAPTVFSIPHPGSRAHGHHLSQGHGAEHLREQVLLRDPHAKAGGHLLSGVYEQGGLPQTRMLLGCQGWHLQVVTPRRAFSPLSEILDTRKAQSVLSVTDLWYLAVELSNLGMAFSSKDRCSLSARTIR